MIGINRLSYKLAGDITWLEDRGSINFELTFIDSTAVESTLEIETEQWVYDCCLKITTQPGLRIYLKQNYNYYPKITDYLRLHKSLSFIKLNRAADLVMQNIMKTD